MSANYAINVTAHHKNGTVTCHSIDVLLKRDIENEVDRIIKTGFNEKKWGPDVDHLEITNVVDRYGQPVKFVWGVRTK